MPSRRVATLSLCSCFAAYLIDQATKNTYFASEPSSGFSLLGGLISQTWHRNSGITFNLPVPSWIILILTIIAILFILRGIHRAIWRSSSWEGLALGLLLGGALGNFVDRWTLAYVRDWILLFNRSALNLADISIFLGLAGYLVLQCHWSKRMVVASSEKVIH